MPTKNSISDKTILKKMKKKLRYSLIKKKEKLKAFIASEAVLWELVEWVLQRFETIQRNK